MPRFADQPGRRRDRGLPGGFLRIGVRVIGRGRLGCPGRRPAPAIDWADLTEEKIAAIPLLSTLRGAG